MKTKRNKRRTKTWGHHKIDPTAPPVTGAKKARTGPSPKLNNNTNNTQSNPQNTQKLPKFRVQAENISNIINKIKLNCNTRPLFKQTPNNLLITPANIKDFHAIKALLINSNTSFTTTDPQSEKKTKIIFKYIDKSYTNEQIEIDLREQGIEFINVGRLSKKRISLNIILITALKASADKLYKLKTICDCEVTVSRYNSALVTQCHRCLQYGHHSSNCGFPLHWKPRHK